MLLLIFQKDSNLISVIASVIPSDTYATTFLVKLIEILMCSDFILFGPLYVSFLVFNYLCLIHSIRAQLPNPSALGVIPEGHQASHLCVILDFSSRKLFTTLWVFFFKFYTFLSSVTQTNLLYALFLIFILFPWNYCLSELKWLYGPHLNLMFETVLHFLCQILPLSLSSLPSNSQFYLCYYIDQKSRFSFKVVFTYYSNFMF